MYKTKSPLLVEEKLNKEERKRKSIDATVAIGKLFVSALILYLSWPAILNIFPSIEGSGVVADEISYWSWFGFVTFMHVIRYVIKGK